jgi:uncharacterized phage protein (TIGR02218 family)
VLATTFNFGGTIGELSVFLLTDPPNWLQPLKSTFTILQGGAVGLSNRETRRPHSATLRTSLEYQSTRTGADARELIGALRELNTQVVLCPFWPAAVRWIDPIPAAALYVVWKDDWSQWEIYSDTPPVWPDADPGEVLVAPLLWGRLAKRETPWPSTDTLTFDVQFIEDGPADYALVPPAAEFGAGPLPLTGYTTAPRLLPYRANFVGIEDSVAINVLRESIGFGRQQTQTFYAQAAQHAFKLPYFLDGQSAAFEFLRFFLDHAGPGASFWTPGWMSAAQLTADAAAADTVLQVADTNSLKVGDYIALLNSGAGILPAIVSALADTTVTLLAPIGADHVASDTIVTPLLLVRLDKPTLQIDWQNPHAAAATLQLIELPAEYAPATGETIGDTLGQLGGPTGQVRCYLYEFTRDLGGETITDRYTSYEVDVTLGEDTYAAAQIEHGDILQGIALEQDAVQVTGGAAFQPPSVPPVSPLLLFATLKMEAPLKLTIRQADVAGGIASEDAVLFVGEIASVKIQGSKITAKAVTASTVFDRKIPRFYLQVPCNHALFSVGCGLDKDDWQFTAEVLSAPSAAYPFAVALHSLAGPDVDFAEHWFSGGWIEFGAGAALQRRAILNSTTVTVGALTVWLNRPFEPLPEADDEVVLFPGCDLRAETCQDKFDNYLNYGGHPFLPAANPSLIKLAQPVAGGKK